MDPRRPALATLLTLVVLAGCLGGPGTTPTPDPSATATATPTSTPTERPPSTEDCPAYVSVDPVDEVPGDATVTPYGDLSEERRSEFETALSEGNAEVEDGGEAYSFWVDRPYVRYEGTVYRAVVAVC
ncbi:hypothetical protein [Halogeometricum luteum]|uniref:DUF7979 domain-containing protein n=1 Tax=Halogeometricum luteum TaxID=2950537 RepID=A0ABU2FZC9_9EURY|nr:hypothetical protein [Halogeometricum sp. S3BR5-2]MDS0293890.1 hypothetical protein [Halogeometricum sp. S3BR5-2]